VSHWIAGLTKIMGKLFKLLHPAAVVLFSATAVSACGARSVMMEAPEGQPSSWVGAGGIEGGTGFVTGGDGGAVESTGGKGGTINDATGGAAGGTYAIGGDGGATNGTGGAGGGSLDGCQYPSCIWNLIRDCRANGPCTEDNSGSNSVPKVYKLCCANGFNKTTTVNQSSTTLDGTVAVTKDGAKCYDVNVKAALDGSQVTRYVWTTPDGLVAANASLTSDDALAIVCTNGETLALRSGCPAAGSSSASPSNGTCP
jgi:hypothetical protein